MKRLVLIAAVAAVLAACGGGGSTSEVLRPTSPVLGDLYLQVHGPSGLLKAERSFSSGSRMGALVAVPAANGRKDCSQTFHINPMKPLSGVLEKFAGKQFTLTIYGNSSFAPAVCRSLLRGGFAGGVLRDYTIPSSAMEPTLHCARPAPGCLGSADDRVVMRLDGAAHFKRFDVVVFEPPREAAVKCGESGTFVKRIIGLPGDTVREDDHGFIWVRSAGAAKFLRLDEPYLSTSRRLADSAHFGELWRVPQGDYFTLGDNRANSCDSRAWGSVPGRDIAGTVLKIIRNGKSLRQRQLGVGGGDY